MRLTSPLRLAPIKLHTRTTILISAILMAIFGVFAYFSDLAITSLSDQQEQQQAQLLAVRVADTVALHIKRERRQRKGKSQPAEETVVPNWAEVQEAIADTIFKNNPQLSQARVLHKTSSARWEEMVKFPLDAATLSEQEQQQIEQPGEGARVVSVREQDGIRHIRAISPVTLTPDQSGPVQFGTVMVALAFDENQSYAARLRRLIWPLMLLVIVAVTLNTYFLFRHLIYKPIDNLLLAMSEAEAGNLAAEVEPAAPDEIGLLTSRFNRMLGRIRQVTEQLNSEQRKLEERVREATAEIAERTGQLEEANLQLFEMQRQLTRGERLAATGQLAAQFAHEVGTPLNLISGHVQLLRARATDEKMIKRLDVIASQIDRIAGIVRSMLDSTRRPKLRLESVDINALVARTLDAAQPTLAARNVELRTEMAEGLAPLEADPEQLQQVFINLINNALDAMPSGGAIILSTEQEQGALRIALSDTGEGISQEQIDLIFEPLFSTKQGRGAGLGLTIVKQIISEHSGAINVESEQGRGTTFHIRLPISIAPVESSGGIEAGADRLAAARSPQGADR